MKDDPIVAEIRATRARLLAECDGDLDRLMDRYKASEESDRHRVVTLEDVLEKRRTRLKNQTRNDG